jgi:anti-anti-sigma factor
MLNIDTRGKSAGVFEVSLEGRLDNLTYERLETTLKPILDKSPRVVQFDMAGLDYISSMGLSVMLQTMKTLNAGNGQIMLTRLQPRVRKVFEIANLLPEQSVFASVEEADRYFDAMQRKEQDT